MAKQSKVVKKENLLKFIPLMVTLLIIIFFFVLIFMPLQKKISSRSLELKKEKERYASVKDIAHNIERIRKEVRNLKSKVANYEKLLPQKQETTLLIDTLKEITREARIKFVSFEPQAVNRFPLPNSEKGYLELPIRMRLKCGFYELLTFLEQVELSKRLIKVTNIRINRDPLDEWGHNVELTIATYALED